MSEKLKPEERPAFPQDPSIGRPEWWVQGMSLREYYAGQAMMGLLADHKDHEDEIRITALGDFEYRGIEYKKGDSVPEEITTRNIFPEGRVEIRKMTVKETCAQAVARLAVEQADALLAELIKEQKL